MVDWWFVGENVSEAPREASMSELLKDLTSFHWWMGVVIVGIVINLASDYLKPRADKLLSSMSTWYGTRTESLSRASQERMYKYIHNSKFEFELEHMEIRKRLSSIQGTTSFLILFGMASMFSLLNFL
jgi:hypothetical protein